MVIRPPAAGVARQAKAQTVIEDREQRVRQEAAANDDAGQNIDELIDDLARIMEEHVDMNAEFTDQFLEEQRQKLPMQIQRIFDCDGDSDNDIEVTGGADEDFEIHDLHNKITVKQVRAKP